MLYFYDISVCFIDMRFAILTCAIGLVSFSGCNQQPSISVFCEQDVKEGNYILKWEMYPEKDNEPLAIFVSDNDSVFPSSPSITVKSNDYISVIKDTMGACTRKYFRIKVGGILSDVISNRFFDLDSVQNFRDIGGYHTSDNHRIRWGKIYRSGSFSLMDSRDSAELKKLGVKTIFDIRAANVTPKYFDTRIGINSVRLPISNSSYTFIAQKVIEGRFLRGDAIIYTQDMYKDIIDNYADQYACLFEYLCDENNYPLVYHCYLGKDQTGLATFFLLKALDVPMDVIEDDYMASAVGIDRSKMIKSVDDLSESQQEAFTMLTKTDLAYLKYAISCMRNKAGSVEEYMLKELRLTPEKRDKLRKILLY